MIVKLPDAIVLHVSGKDSERYLNARLTAPVKFMKDGDSLPSAALNAKGRVESFLRIKRLSSTEFLLVIDGGLDQLSVISRFKVADRVEIKELPLLVYHSTEGGDAEYRVNSKRVGDTGEDLLVSEPIQENASLNEFHFQRVLYGMPQFPIEFNEKTLFSEYLIEEAISFKKGCYVGQEVVEKIDALGETPMVLVRFKTSAPFEKSKEIVSSYELGGSIVGFARVSRDAIEDLPYKSNLLF